LGIHTPHVVNSHSPRDTTKVALQLRSANLVWSKHDPSSLFTPSGGHDDPVTNEEIITVGSEVIDAPGIPEPHTDHTLRRRDVVKPEDRVTITTTALPDLLARFQAALEALARPCPGLLDRRRRRPGSR
jgi:hypothetical protein